MDQVGLFYPTCVFDPVLLEAKLDYFTLFYGQARECYRKGLSVTEAMKELSLKEKYLLRIVTANDVAVRHMVQSVYDSEENT